MHWVFLQTAGEGASGRICPAEYAELASLEQLRPGKVDWILFNGRLQSVETRQALDIDEVGAAPDTAIWSLLEWKWPLIISREVQS
jgi:hypothetical protein